MSSTTLNRFTNIQTVFFLVMFMEEQQQKKAWCNMNMQCTHKMDIENLNLPK